MLAKSDIELDLIYDEKIYEITEYGLPGGMCQVTYRKVGANNPHMRDQYDENTEISYLSYLDANILYGLAISHKIV